MENFLGAPQQCLFEQLKRCYCPSMPLQNQLSYHYKLEKKLMLKVYV